MRNKTQKERSALSYELQQALIQCCIDFINKHQLEGVSVVKFLADELDYSAKVGEWHPYTDCSLTICDLVEDENGYMSEKELVCSI